MKVSLKRIEDSAKIGVDNWDLDSPKLFDDALKTASDVFDNLRSRFSDALEKTVNEALELAIKEEVWCEFKNKEGSGLTIIIALPLGESDAVETLWEISLQEAIIENHRNWYGVLVIDDEGRKDLSNLRDGLAELIDAIDAALAAKSDTEL